MRLVGALLDRRIAVAESSIPAGEAVEARLLPGERAVVRGAAAVRRHQFSVGRVLCRQALVKLGFPASAVLQGHDRAPVWPRGVVGSITHSETWCAAAVAREDDVRSLGIDVESMSPIERELWSVLCTDQELDWIHSLPAAERGVAVKLVFSAKESFYKAQYPLTKEFCDFESVSTAFDMHKGRWWCTCRRNLGDVYRKDHVLHGRFTLRAGMIATSIVIEHARS